MKTAKLPDTAPASIAIMTTRMKKLLLICISGFSIILRESLCGGLLMRIFFVLVTNGPLKGNKYVVRTDCPILIGRSKKAAIKIRYDELASRKHALIFWQDNACYLEDLDSTNGSSVNDQPVTGTKKLENGDILRLGSTEMAIFVQDIPDLEM